jgi:hypothetical protein
MKCPRCWAHKAYARHVGGWKGVLMDCLLLQPMKCHHCYHKFIVPWFFTFGKEVRPPQSRSRRTAPSLPPSDCGHQHDPAQGTRSGHRARASSRDPA